MQIIHKNKLKCGSTYIVTALGLDNINDILTLQKLSLANLEQKSFLQPLTSDEYKYILNGNGLIVGCFIESQLIAIRALLAPPIDDDHLGLEAGLTASELHKVIYQEISFVAPLYRGNGLQQKLGHIAMEQLNKHDNQYNYICATVAPLNIPSLLDKFRQQMVIMSLKQVYDDKWRYIFFKNLNSKGELHWTVTKKVPMSHYNEQIKLLHDGWIGYSLIKQSETYYIVYGRKNG